jgi:hypothetical protein
MAASSKQSLLKRPLHKKSSSDTQVANYGIKRILLRLRQNAQMGSELPSSYLYLTYAPM